MARPSPSKIASVLLGDEVYGLDLDSRIRQAGNSMSARSLFELLGRLDEDAPDFGGALRAGLMEFPMEDPTVLIGFDDGTFRNSGEPLDDSGRARPGMWSQ